MLATRLPKANIAAMTNRESRIKHRVSGRLILYTAMQVIVQVWPIRMIESTEIFSQPVNPVNEQLKGSE
jgi:hypothetical protein